MEFLEAQKALLAAEVNRLLEELLHGDTRWLKGPAAAVSPALFIGGGFSSEEEKEQIESLNDWIERQGLPRGILAYELVDTSTGEQKAIFDLAWPSGIQEELSQPVAVLLNEGSEILNIANQADYRFFTTIEDFKRYVLTKMENVKLNCILCNRYHNHSLGK